MNARILLRTTALVLWLSSAHLLAQSSTPNSQVFLRLAGVRTGTFEGEVTQKGREGWHKLLAYSHEIVSPRDAASGLPTGRRQHQPFRVVKLINKSSPLLLQALATNEQLRTVEIEIWSPSVTGAEVKLLTYTLSNAQIVSLRPWMPNKADPAVADYAPAEEISFVYQKIEVVFHNGGVTGSDDWTQNLP